MVACTSSGNDVPNKMPCTQTLSTGVAVVALGHGALTKRLTQLLINQVRIKRSRSSVPCYNKSRRDSSTYLSQPRPGSSRKSASHRAGAKPSSRDLPPEGALTRQLHSESEV